MKTVGELWGVSTKKSIDSLIFVGCYIFLTYSDVLLIAKNQQECRIGYGMGVFVRILGDHNVNLGRASKGLSYILIVLSCIFGISSLRRNYNLPGRKDNDIYLSAFRAGASIYIGTFLLSNNFPYRLIFLIFTIPQLVMWAKESAVNISMISKATIVAVFISMWSLVITRLLGSSPWYVEFTIRAVSSWLVFVCLMYLMFWSMPAWIKEAAQKHLKICATA
jgi:hypothetical protein